MSPRSATTLTSILRLTGPRRRFISTQDATATTGAENTMKRFWKEVGIERRGDSHVVTLDKRPLKTPEGNTLLLPGDKPLVTSLIAIEWDNLDKVIKPHALPMTSLAARAIDAFAEKQTCEEIKSSLLNYLDTDTICFYQDHPSHLADLQKKHWDPLHKWIQTRFGVKMTKAGSILYNSQPEETKTKLAQVLDSLDQWELAAMERATLTTKSFVIGLALVMRQTNPEDASLAAQVEVDSQTERWGEVEDTHDVDYHDVRRQLGSVACLVSKS
ncbi:hypothetical protein AMATHDRAFT_56975 [Amanita thiersii Skay4041]|uniref:ATP12-domain-containing protein n=1 Tax=Amanita thiersii Skay4041 TaxID=703135 RepID=A0A2A9NVT3_9AGAR|nr:hypothetical protein AMATHDRAFT_56975 [Amanita thiersii Skay4041]